MTDAPNLLGDYLRARRELVTPRAGRHPGAEGATGAGPAPGGGGDAGRHQRLRDLFLDPAECAFYPDWDKATAGLVGGFRQSVGTDTDDPRVIELVGELSLSSPRFRQLWARHDVADRRGAAMRLDHPQVGELRLNREKLLVTGTEGIMLVPYHPDPETDDADKLALLASISHSSTSSCPADSTAASADGLGDLFTSRDGGRTGRSPGAPDPGRAPRTG